MKWHLTEEGPNKVLAMDMMESVKPKQQHTETFLQAEGITSQKEVTNEVLEMDFLNPPEQAEYSSDKVINETCNRLYENSAEIPAESVDDSKSEEEEEEEEEEIASVTRKSEPMKMDEALSILRNELVRYLLLFFLFFIFPPHSSKNMKYILNVFGLFNMMYIKGSGFT